MYIIRARVFGKMVEQGWESTRCKANKIANGLRDKGWLCVTIETPNGKIIEVE